MVIVTPEQGPRFARRAEALSRREAAWRRGLVAVRVRSLRRSPMSVAPASGACVKGSAFIASLRTAGFDFFTGVPCSLLEAPIAHLEEDRGLGYVPAVREDEAMGMAAGAWLAGKRLPVVFMQNSGLGNCLNVIASLQRIYDIPTLPVVSSRGNDRRHAPERLVRGDAMPA